MSSEMVKVALRGEIKALEGKSAHDVYEALSRLLGEADDIYRNDDGTIANFFYDIGNHDGWHQCHEWEDGANKWGVEKVFLWEGVYEAVPVILDIQTILDTTEEMVEKFGVDRGSAVLATYTYYTGTDEPVSFTPTITQGT